MACIILILVPPSVSQSSETVLKVRVSDPHLADADFIEVELDNANKTYAVFLDLLCSELEIKPEMVSKIRKLPNTILRKDKDIARLQDFQEIEVIKHYKLGSL